MHRAHKIRIAFAGVVAAAALLITAWKGDLNWMVLLVFSAMFMPGWKTILAAVIKRKEGDNGCP